MHVAILYCGPISGGNGSGERVVQIADELADQGLEITLSAIILTPLKTLNRTNLHVIESPNRMLKPRSVVKWIAKLVASSFTYKHDIVQIEAFSFSKSLALFLLLRPFTRKFIIVFHDKCFQKDPHRDVRGKINLFLQRILLTLFDASITPGTSLKKWFEELHGELVTGKMVVIPNGAPNLVKNSDNSQYVREKYGISPTAFVCLFFGSMSFKPNHDAALYLYRISDYVSHEFEEETGKKLIFVIAGNGSETLPKKRSYVSLGFVNELDELLSLPNLIIIPHLASFSGPHVKTMYAFLSGKPIVATDDAIKDMPGILSRKHFLKFVTDEPNTLVLCLTELYRDKELSEYLAQNAYAYTRIFSWKRIASMHRRLYESFLC